MTSQLPLDHGRQAKLDRLNASLKSFARGVSGGAAVVGCLVLVGWVLEIEVLKRVFPRLVSMNPLTAVSFILAGVSLALWHQDGDRRRRRGAQTIAGVVAMIGLVKLAGIASGWDLGIDRLLFRGRLDLDPVQPNRMAPTTAIGFVLLGSALVCLGAKTRRGFFPAQLLAIATALLALLPVVGYLYGIETLTGFAAFIPMALHTAVLFIALAAGVLCARPDVGLMTRVTSDRAGGVLIRRVVLAAIGIPIVLGWLIVMGQEAGWYDPALAFAMFVVLILVVFALVIWTSAAMLDRKDDERTLAEEKVRQRAAELACANADLRRAREAAESASRAKSTFLANMSHEIRTPLNAVIGMTELVLKSELSAQQREFLATVRDSGEALLSVINDILDFSKIEAGKLVLEREPFDLRESLGDTVKSFALRAHQQGLELACSIHPDVPRVMVGDYGRLRQVVTNLLGNAIKFTEKGEVTLEVLRESGSSEEIDLHFVVSDTGIGIPEEKQSAIFEMFEQVDSTMRRRRGGTGLGLAIASRLVELMEGRIWVESKSGRGSRFHFTVRLGLPETGLVETSPAEPACLHGMRVLVVDDHATNRRILEEVLGSWQMTPVTAPDAWEAIRLIRLAQRAGEPYHLVLTDAHMPHIDGFMLAEQIKQDPDLGSTVVMMLTSGDRPEDVARCEQLGIAAYVLKPVKQSELLQAIERALGVAVPGRSRLLETTSPQQHVRKLKILLAEDSLVNQKLAVAMLEGDGHAVTVANNGKEALAALESGRFDLVLMDVQMPEMDGFEATALIRAREQQSHAHIPIVAMTAHALKGDRERCLEIGMDAYISKPIHLNELAAIIRSLFPGDDAAAAAAGRAKADGEVVDWAQALLAVQGNQGLLRTLVEAVVEETPRMVAGIREAIGEADPVKLRLSAHTLRGSLRYFGAGAAVEYASRLEDLAKEGSLVDAKAFLAGLESELARITPALLDYLDQPQSDVAP